jgi:hypothetical protein
MSPPNANRFAHEAMRGTRPDAYRFIRPDWRRFVVPGSELAELYETIERKYSPDQPRVPAGNRDGGQWTSGGGGGGAGGSGDGGGTGGNSDRSAGGSVPRPSSEDPTAGRQRVAQLLPPLLSEPPVVPRPIIEPPLEEWPTNPKQAPPGYQWRGQPGSAQGDGKGSYIKPKQPGDAKYPSLRYDEGSGHKPHWDYRAPDGKEYRWYPDGTLEPKGEKPIIMFRLDA